MRDHELKGRVSVKDGEAYVILDKDRNEVESLNEPLYSLNLVLGKNGITDYTEYKHYYSKVYNTHIQKPIEGLHLKVVELEKFNKDTDTESDIQHLWMCFLTGIGEGSENIAAELRENKEIEIAIKELERDSYSASQLYAYSFFKEIMGTI